MYAYDCGDDPDSSGDFMMRIQKPWLGMPLTSPPPSSFLEKSPPGASFSDVGNDLEFMLVRGFRATRGNLELPVLRRDCDQPRIRSIRIVGDGCPPPFSNPFVGKDGERVKVRTSRSRK